jgi:hypothetical protein
MGFFVRKLPTQSCETLWITPLKQESQGEQAPWLLAIFGVNLDLLVGLSTFIIGYPQETRTYPQGSGFLGLEGMAAPYMWGGEKLQMAIISVWMIPLGCG